MRFDISNSLVLADQTDNSSDISSNNGQFMGVTLSDRTLYRDGDWNTLCLPFNMGDATAAEGHHFDGTELEGATVMQLNPATSNLTDGTLTVKTVATGIRPLRGDGRLVDVYTPAGVKVRSQVHTSEALRGLPAGIYVIEGDKIVVPPTSNMR